MNTDMSTIILCESTVSRKSEVSLHASNKSIMGNGGRTPLIFNLGIRWRLSVHVQAQIAVGPIKGPPLPPEYEAE